MATPTPLHHPKAVRQGQNAFRYKANFGSRKSGAFVSEAGLNGLPAAYQPSMGSEAPMFNLEGKSLDKVLIQGWYPAIRQKMRLILEWPSGTTRREFEVQDAMPGDSGPTTTLLTVTPV